MISKNLNYVILALGVIFRLRQYLNDRSLWLDEAFITLNILNRSYLDLLSKLDFNQGAPAGFLIVEKFLIQIFGNSEFTLRFFPLLCGILSLFLFYNLLKSNFGNYVTLIALTLFSFLDPLIYYSSEVKQYSGDVFFTLLLFQFINKELNFKNSIIFGILSAISIWFSYPAIFISISMILCFLLVDLKKNQKVLVSLIISGISFYFIYMLQLGNLNTNSINFFHESCFMPLPPTFSWFKAIFSQIFIFLKLVMFYIPQGMFVLGILALFYKNKKIFWFFIAPFIIVFFVSTFKIYPVIHRLTLFLSPLILVFTAYGLSVFLENKRKPIYLTGLIITQLLLIPPIILSIKNFIKPEPVQEIKMSLDFINKNKSDRDIIYIYHSAQYAFKHYAPKFGFYGGFDLDPDEYKSAPDLKRNYYIKNYNPIIIGITSYEDKNKYFEEIKTIKIENKGKRIWFLFSHVSKNEKSFYLNCLDKVGKRILSFEVPGYFEGSSAYLYSFLDP